MASSARIDELKKKFDENPRRYFAPLANEFRKAGDVSQALMICEEFLPAQPGHMSGHIVYGQALYESNRLDEARATFETALDLDPENVIALRHLGDIASTQGDSGAAKVWYWRVLDADPRNEEIQALIASLPAEQANERTAAAHSPPRESHSTPAAPAPSLHTPTESMPVQRSVAEHSEAERSEEPTREVTAAELDAATALHVPLAEFSLDGMESEPETESLMPAIADAPPGLESAEFVPPSSGATGDSLELDESFEAGIDAFAVPPVHYGSLRGLESSGEAPTQRALSSIDATPLDIEGGLIPDGDELSAIDELPTHDELSALEASDPAAWAPLSDAPMELPPSVIAAEAELIERGESPAPADFVDDSPQEIGAEDLELADFSFSEPVPASDMLTGEDRAESAMMLDDAPIDGDATTAPDASTLPEWEAALTAAESAPVVDGEPAHPEHHDAAAAAVTAEASSHEQEQEQEQEYGDDDDDASTIAQRPFVTETMAALYVKQGFREEALSVYRQLLDASPDDARLRARVAELETVATEPADSGPNVRDFFAQLASRVPGARGDVHSPPSSDDFATDDDASMDEQFASHEQFASSDDFASFDAIEAPVTADEPQAPTTQHSNGSIDALFGTDARPDTMDSTPSALADAFAPESEVPPIPGRPARAATGELSLESVFRDGPQGGARRSQSFSFDQFFSDGAVAGPDAAARPTPRQAPEIPSPSEPAERGADDIEQFNAWLQSLKQR